MRAVRVERQYRYVHEWEAAVDQLELVPTGDLRDTVQNRWQNCPLRGKEAGILPLLIEGCLWGFNSLHILPAPVGSAHSSRP